MPLWQTSSRIRTVFHCSKCCSGLGSVHRGSPEGDSGRTGCSGVEHMGSGCPGLHRAAAITRQFKWTDFSFTLINALEPILRNASSVHWCWSSLHQTRKRLLTEFLSAEIKVWWLLLGVISRLVLLSQLLVARGILGTTGLAKLDPLTGCAGLVPLSSGDLTGEGLT